SLLGGLLRLLLAFELLGDAGNATHPAIPGGADAGKLLGGPGELGVVDAVAALASGGAAVDEARSVEQREVLGHGLAGDGELLTQGRGRAGAVDQQEVEHPAPGRVAHGRPELVVDGDGHDATVTVGAYEASRGRK